MKTKMMRMMKMKTTKEELYHILSNAVAVEVDGVFEYIDEVHHDHIRTFIMRNDFARFGEHTLDDLIANDVTVYELKAVKLEDEEDEE